MKKYLNISVLTVLMTLSACSSDFLDLSDPTKLNSGSFYETEAQFTQAMNGVYSQLQEYVGGAWMWCEMISDNTTIHFNQGDRGQGPGREAIEYWQINSNTMEQIGPYNLYNGVYGYLVNINTILAKLKTAELSDDVKNKIEGQMRFMRAYYYFQLVQLFGEVIVVTEPIINPDDAWTFARSPVADVYNLIDEDVKFAVGALPASWDAANVGRPTKGAALTLQGRTFLVRHQYGDAITAFTEVTKLGYEILPDYADVFDPTKKNGKESIMEVQFQGGNDLGESSGFLNDFYPRESYGAVIPFPGANGGGWNVPTLQLIREYQAGDLRKAVSLREGYVSVDANSPAPPGEWVAVPYINKFNHPYTIQGRPDDNWPLMRYAEVVLSLAEAINEQDGPTTAAYGYLNQIRTRAGLTTLSGLTKESFRDSVLHERRLELAFENHRLFDLKRTMDASQLATFLNAYSQYEKANPSTPTRTLLPYAIGDFEFASYEALLPIPARERRLNPELTQNTGY